MIEPAEAKEIDYAGLLCEMKKEMELPDFLGVSNQELLFVDSYKTITQLRSQVKELKELKELKEQKEHDCKILKDRLSDTQKDLDQAVKNIAELTFNNLALMGQQEQVIKERDRVIVMVCHMAIEAGVEGNLWQIASSMFSFEIADKLFPEEKK